MKIQDDSNTQPLEVKVDLGVMKDIQKQKPLHSIKIRNVGVKKVFQPIEFIEAPGAKPCPSVARFDLSVTLAASEKGTHMSRFFSVLYSYLPQLSLSSIKEMGKELVQKLETTSSHSKISFSYFYEAFAPVSGTKGISQCFIKVLTTVTQAEESEQTIILKVPVKSLCPCSKSISKYGAHAQRSYIKIWLKNPTKTIHSYIDLIESCGSAKLYPILKREDEKFITEFAYENPKFVEDLVRDVAHKLQETESWFIVKAENFESIHHHDVWAEVRSTDL